MQKQNEYMKKALEIAFDNMGLTSPNPSVGAVIVKDNKIVSTGGTCPYGGDHAEVNAIKESKGHDLKGAEMYVSLEPCCHHGKTPPCTDAIIKSGITKVFIPITDPNPQVAGKGIKILKDAGIEVVILDNMKEMAYDLLRPFCKYILQKKTFIVNKCAISLDGRIATKTGDSKWISSNFSRYITHKLRAKVDAIIIGKNTFQNDNPSLNVRLDDFKDLEMKSVKEFESSSLGRYNYFLENLLHRKINNYNNPLRIIVGFPDNFVNNGKLYYQDNYIIITDEDELDEVIKQNSPLSGLIDKINIKIIKKNEIDNKINIIINYLYEQGIMFALLEGGGQINGSFLASDAIDQFLYFVTPKIFGNGISAVENSGIENVTDCTQLKDVTAMMLKQDVLYSAYK